MRLNRKVIVGFWQDPEVLAKIGMWARAAYAWDDSQGMRVARFGDNMREVAVTEGDKVEAQIRFGYSVSGFGVGDLVKFIGKVTDAEIDKLLNEYKNTYSVGASDEGKVRSLREEARIEAGLRNFLNEGKFKAFTTTFEDLHGIVQLPGLAVQRPCPYNEGNGRRSSRRNLFHGRLHL